eukprot:629738-Amphidinium_carterae.3
MLRAVGTPDRPTTGPSVHPDAAPPGESVPPDSWLPGEQVSPGFWMPEERKNTPAVSPAGGSQPEPPSAVLSSEVKDVVFCFHLPV